MAAARTDLLILGGGLAGGLAAMAVKARHPDLSVTIVERDTALGGNHVWSFFASDVDADGAALLAPLVEARWTGYEVRFPEYQRRLDTPYASMTSERLDAELRRALPGDAIVHGDVVEAGPTHAVLADGRRLEAGAVIDMRGIAGQSSGLLNGYQKFVGRMMRVVGGHGVREPVVMDASVPQGEGYRFVYLLPFSDTDLFIEDTYYQEDSELDVEALSRRITHYAKLQGWQAEPAGRLETGVLPVVTGGDFEAFWPAGDPLARGGVRAGLFHPLTSYSVPDAVRFAQWLADRLPAGGATLARDTRDHAEAHWKRGGFDRMLARMLFKAAEPEERYRILQRFYRLPSGLIERFYAGQSTLGDRARILAGRPPVAITRALRAILGTQ